MIFNRAILIFLGMLPLAELSAAITSTVNTSGALIITTTFGSDCIITLRNGLVKINNSDPDSGPVQPTSVTSLTFTGDDFFNDIDLSVIQPETFPNFTQATINALGGDDSLLCTGFNNTVNMGTGTDTVSNFGGGFTLFDWAPGDGTESIVNDGTGTVRLRFQGSTGADQITLSSPSAGVLQLTNNILGDSISFENLTDLALQLNDGEDVIVANDMSTVNWGTAILCNKNSGSLKYNGPNSNQAANFFINGASTQINVTPNSGCEFAQNPLFSASPFNFLITKPNQRVRVSYQFNSAEVVHQLRGLSKISLSGTPNNDVFTVENVGSQSLESLTLIGSDGSDTVNAVFQTNTKLVFSETNFHSGSDTLIVDAEGKTVIQTANAFETNSGFGRIEFSNVETVELLNTAAPLVDLWMVD